MSGKSMVKEPARAWHTVASGPPALIAALLRPTAYPEAAADVRLRETHLSWIFLVGDYAYKVKKPVDLGFVDFSTIARRAIRLEDLVGPTSVCPCVVRAPTRSVLSAHRSGRPGR